MGAVDFLVRGVAVFKFCCYVRVVWVVGLCACVGSEFGFLGFVGSRYGW